MFRCRVSQFVWALAVSVVFSRGASAATLQWDFDGNLAPTGAGGALVANAAAPAFDAEVIFLSETIAGAEATVASFSRGTFFTATVSLDANGGGSFLNRYTLIMDVMFPEGTTGWQALYQTNAGNSNDGDWFVEPDSRGGGIGISGNYGGNVADGTWHRLALVVDSDTGTYTSYINGVQVQQNTGLARDGRFSVGSLLHFFADENEENAAGFVNSIQLRDVALSAAEIAVLGGPSATGIPSGLPPPPAPVGLWEFDNAAQLTESTVGLDLDLTGGHQAVAGITQNDGAVRVGLGSYYRVTHQIAPNGGGSFVNQFTLLVDFKVPSLGSWYCFYQTNEQNANDGDAFVRTDGALGVSATGYSAVVVEPDTWYRAVVAVDNREGRYDIYLDGERVLDGTGQPLDGRFSLDPTLLLFADDNGDDAPIDVSTVAIFDRALFAGEVIRLGGAGPSDPDNQPPALVQQPAGPSSGETGEELMFSFLAEDPDGDQVQFRVDWGDGTVDAWSPLQPVTEPYVTPHTYDTTGLMRILVMVRDEHGATTFFEEVQTVQVTGDVLPVFLTEPYLQNLKKHGITIMWELDELVAAEVEFGPDNSYGATVAATSESSGFSSFIYKAVITGLDPGAEYHFRVLASQLVGRDRTFRTAPEGRPSFKFGVWSDSQGFNRGAFPADPLEPTKKMMAHMAAQKPDFAVTAGDLAENGSSYTDTRNFYLDRVAKFLGQTVPWFNAWGNHDSRRGAVLRKFADMPSKDRPGFGPGDGSYSFDYAGCHFVCIDFTTQVGDILTWLEGDLSSPAARDAKFTFLIIHVPPYCELWIDGDSWLRANLVPMMERYGVDACFSGHTHEYERGQLNDIFYVVTGGGSWLDFPESLVRDWPHMTRGGFHDLPGGVDKGLVNEYVMVEVDESSFTCTMYAFNFDGSVKGVLDGFFRCDSTLGEFVDLDGDTLPDAPPPDFRCVPCPQRLTCVADQVERTVALTWDPAETLDATGYELVRNGVVLDLLPLSAREFVDVLDDAALGSQGLLHYQLRAVGSADADSCAVLSCRLTVSTGNVLFQDDFEAYEDDLQFELAGWFVVEVNEPVEASAWTLTNPGRRGNPPSVDGRPTRGRFVISDSDWGGGDGANPPGSGMSHDLWSPEIDCRGADEVWLHLDVSAQLNNNGEAVFDIDVSRDTGVSWTNVFRRVSPSRTSFAPVVTVDNADGFYGRLDVDLTRVAAGEPDVRFRIRHFEPNFDWWIAVDNVVVDDVAPPRGATSLLLEDFRNGIPAAWEVRGLRTGANTWTTSDPCNRSVVGGSFPHQDGRGVHRLGSRFAIIDSDCDPDAAEDEYLITPVLDCSAFKNVTLHWRSEIVKSAVEEVLLSLDGGATFLPEPLFSYAGGGLIDAGEDSMFAARSMSVPQAAGEERVAFAFHFQSGGDEWWWAVDDVEVTADPEVRGSGQVPTDCNQDGAVDISDAICLLIFLFQGGGALPCGDGTREDAANIALLSANGDLSIDISDAIYLLTHLFGAGPNPVLGVGCVEIPGCAGVCGE